MIFLTVYKIFEYIHGYHYLLFIRLIIQLYMIYNHIVENVPDTSIDFSLCVFVLSAIDSSMHIYVLKRIHSKLKQGGIILFRDYGMYDLTMIRSSAKPDRLLGENTYSRGDGTMSYFFTKEYILKLANKTGFDVIQNDYCCVINKNRKKNLDMHRIWLQASLRKI